MSLSIATISYYVFFAWYMYLKFQSTLLNAEQFELRKTSWSNVAPMIYLIIAKTETKTNTLFIASYLSEESVTKELDKIE